MKLIRVCHLITELNAGGAQSILLNFLKHADRERFDHSVVCLFHGDGEVAGQIRALGIDVTDIRLRSAWSIGRAFALIRLLKRMQPHILHCWMFHANVLGRITGRMAKTALIVTSRHNVHIGGPRREQLKRMTADLDDHVIAVSNAVRDVELKEGGAKPEKVTTIYNGVADVTTETLSAERCQELRSSFDIDDKAKIAIVVGRLHPQKGHEILFQALRLIHMEYPQLYVLIVGEGALGQELLAAVRRLGLEDRVRFAGVRDDVIDLLHMADVFVLPSLWEGFPMAILEAMMAGIPIVATRVGGVPELVDETCGLVVPPNDAEALSQAVLRIMRDRTFSESLAKRALLRVREHFTIVQTVQKTEALYAQLLGEKLGMTYVDTEWTTS